MTFSVRAENIRFDSDNMWLGLTDGRTLGVPLAWFPRLLHASKKELNAVRISKRGLHWDNLDEDISVAGLLAGLNDRSRSEAA